MPDETDVTGLRGPSLDDVLDVVSRTNRAILALEEAIHSLRTYVIFAVVYIAAILLYQRKVAV